MLFSVKPTVAHRKALTERFRAWGIGQTEESRFDAGF